MHKKLFSLVAACIIFFTACGSETSSLKVQKETLEKQISELEEEISALERDKSSIENYILELREENNIPKYIVTFEIGQSHVTLDIGDLLKDELNTTELEVMVSKEYYDAIEVGTVVNNDVRVGSLALKGSFGSWRIEIINKRVEY